MTYQQWKTTKAQSIQSIQEFLGKWRPTPVAFNDYLPYGVKANGYQSNSAMDQFFQRMIGETHQNHSLAQGIDKYPYGM